MNALPFGAHRGKPLVDVPANYLDWFIRNCKLSSGLRAAVTEELARRGRQVPEPPPPPPPGPCTRCGSTGLRHTWSEDSLGRRQIRRECVRCHQLLGFAPQVEPFVAEADKNAGSTPHLDVLVQCDALGISLRSDGKAVDFKGAEDRAKASPRLREMLAQCRHTLAQMLGPGREEDRR